MVSFTKRSTKKLYVNTVPMLFRQYSAKYDIPIEDVSNGLLQSVGSILADDDDDEYSISDKFVIGVEDFIYWNYADADAIYLHGAVEVWEEIVTDIVELDQLEDLFEIARRCGVDERNASLRYMVEVIGDRMDITVLG